jgi:pilus assembly protein CpaE
MMRHTLAFLCADARLIQRLQDALGTDCAVMAVDPRQPDGEAAIRRLDPEAIVMDAGAPAGTRTVLERIADIKTAFAGVALIAIGDEMSAQLILASFRAGADEFLDRDASDAEIRAAILARLRQKGHDRDGKAALISVLSPSPCDEDADLALNIASVIAAAHRDHRTLLLDLSLPVSPARTALGLDLRFNAGAAIRDVARLDRTFLDSACARVAETGLYVLPLAGDDSDGALPQPRDLAMLVPMLRALFDTVVVYWGAFSRQAADSGHAFVCCNQRFSSIRNAKTFLARFKSDGAVAPVLAIHQLNAHIVPSPQDIQDAVGAGSALVLHTSWSRLTNAHNQGRPLALGETNAYGDALRFHLAEAGLLPRAASDHPTLKLLNWLRR